MLSFPTKAKTLFQQMAHYWDEWTMQENKIRLRGKSWSKNAQVKEFDGLHKAHI